LDWKAVAALWGAGPSTLLAVLKLIPGAPVVTMGHNYDTPGGDALAFGDFKQSFRRHIGWFMESPLGGVHA
jgi:hypothetical protein